jgi:hypothetical protein
MSVASAVESGCFAWLVLAVILFTCLEIHDDVKAIIKAHVVEKGDEKSD